MKVKLVFISLLLASTSSLASVCLLTGAVKLPKNTKFAVSQTIYDLVVAQPEIETMIYAARNPWLIKTRATNRIGDWNDTITSSDCPSTSGVFQIGALSFSQTNNCAAVNALENPASTLAFVDYYSTSCTGCGTKSITLNLDHGWTLDPDTDQNLYDAQSTLTHEFGHVLGMGHQNDGSCNDTSTSCDDSDDEIETMNSSSYRGEKCRRTLESNDIQSANDFYLE